ncbi:hypothetical protein FGO68_gene16825 [Halteria grandinella]|uniref:3CxxC-type domain-containing protein n=1 Tax=Halteria grandinella TaxID=5974 RepID=A0A8J8NJ22_HALGN|nr:hypothetical protein FGO68_gene16825 [Halteria grandinella]
MQSFVGASERPTLTPYQGSKRVFGFFRCECGKTWQSGNSWANQYQQCKSCTEKVYPYEQRALEKPNPDDKVDKDKPHLQHLCGKCKTLGRLCTKRFY